MRQSWLQIQKIKIFCRTMQHESKMDQKKMVQKSKNRVYKYKIEVDKNGKDEKTFA